MTDTRLDDLVAKQECAELVYTLCRAIDRLDVALIAACYHADATDDHGMIGGTIQQFIAQLVPVLNGMTSTQHNVTNLVVKIMGDQARSEAYFIAQHSIDTNGKQSELFAAGRYLDRFDRRDGIWRIAHRAAVYDWTMTMPASGHWDGPPLQALLRRGERGRSDVSYAHLAGD